MVWSAFALLYNHHYYLHAELSSSCKLKLFILQQLLPIPFSPHSLAVTMLLSVFMIWTTLTTLLEKAIAPYSSTLAWKIPWTEEPGRLQSMRSLRVRHNWATSLSLFTFMHWRRKWQQLQCSCLENPRDGGAWWAAVYGVAQGRTQPKRLSSSSSSSNYLICVE